MGIGDSRYASATAGWAGVFAGAPASPYDPLRITTQPQSASVFAGTNVQLSVATEGSLPESFQWRRNGVALSGSTTRSLSLPSIQATKMRVSGELPSTAATNSGQVAPPTPPKAKSPAVSAEPAAVGSMKAPGEWAGPPP